MILENTISYSHTDLLSAVMGSRQIRYGSMSAQRVAYIRNVLETCTQEYRPIKCLCNWGAAKGYGQFQIRTADLMDYQAIEVIRCLQLAARQYHPHGLHVEIFWEDYTEKLLTGFRCQDYFKSFLKLLRDMNMGHIRIIRESSLIRDDMNYAAACHLNATALHNGEGERRGWTGPIDWEFYMRRATAERPDLDEGQVKWRIARYLGVALARHQAGVLPKHDLRMSFCPYPASTPDKLRMGRLEYKVKPSKNSHKATTPWVHWGLIRGDDWTCLGVNEMRSGKYFSSTININGITIPVLRETET